MIRDVAARPIEQIFDDVDCRREAVRVNVSQSPHHDVGAIPAGYVAEEDFFDDHLTPRSHHSVRGLDEGGLGRA